MVITCTYIIIFTCFFPWLCVFFFCSCSFVFIWVGYFCLLNKHRHFSYRIHQVKEEDDEKKIWNCFLSCSIFFAGALSCNQQLFEPEPPPSTSYLSLFCSCTFSFSILRIFFSKKKHIHKIHSPNSCTEKFFTKKNNIAFGMIVKIGHNLWDQWMLICHCDTCFIFSFKVKTCRRKALTGGGCTFKIGYNKCVTLKIHKKTNIYCCDFCKKKMKHRKGDTEPEWVKEREREKI